MLATIDFTGSTLTLMLVANEKVVVSNPGENQVRFNVTPYSPGGTHGGGLSFGGIGGGTISIGATINLGSGTLGAVSTVGGTPVVPITGVTSVSGAPIGFSIVGYGSDTTGTLPSAVSLVIKGASGSPQAVDFQQSTNGAFVTASRISVDLGNDANDDVTFSGAIDRTGVVSGDAIKVTGVEDVLLNQPLAVGNGNVAVSAFATAQSTIGLNAAIGATTGDVSLSSRSAVALKGAISTAGAVNVTTHQGIQVNANITGGNGGVSLSANQQATPTAGAFVGIGVSNATITTTNNGNIVLRGRGGIAPWNVLGGQHGVVVRAGGVISSVGTGTIVVVGTGGSGSQSANGSRVVNGETAPNSLSSLSVSVAHQDGSSGSFRAATSVVSANTITLGGTWTLPGNPISRIGSHGVWLDGDATTIMSSFGGIDISGRGGTDSGDYHHGISMTSGAVVESTGDVVGASIRLDGFGGTSSYSGLGRPHNVGVSVRGADTRVMSASGPIFIKGHGGTAQGESRTGVAIGDGAVVQSTGLTPLATISILGDSGPAVVSSLGVGIGGVGTRITSVNGAISIAGRGGVGSDDASCDGVSLSYGALVESTGTSAGATIAITGIAGISGESNAGVSIDDAKVVSAGASIGIRGTGGAGSSSWNHGVFLSRSALVESTGVLNAGAITIVGEGGGTGHGQGNTGVLMSYGQVRVKSSSGAISVSGKAGAGASHGIVVYGGEFGAASVSSTEGSVFLAMDSVDIGPAATVVAKTVALRPRTPGVQVDLGGSDGVADALPTLGLNAGELNRIFAETLVIGAADAGEVRVTEPIELSVPTDVELRSGVGITSADGSVNTRGKALILDPGPSPASVKPLTSGIDVTASGVTLGSALSITINGPAADSEYSRLKINGAVDLAGVDLVLNGPYASPGEFVIVEGTSVTGTFKGLPQGGTVTFNGVTLAVTYAADRVILAPPSNVTTGRLGRGLFVTGGVASDSVQILPGPAPRSFVVTGLGQTTVNGQASVVVRNVISGWRINLGQGNDRLVVGDGASPTTVVGSVEIDVGMLGAMSQVDLKRLTLSGALTIRSASGNNEVRLTRVTVGGQFTFAGGAGDDQLTIQGSRFRQHARMSFGRGANRVTIAGAAFQRTAAIHFAQLAANEIDAGLLSTPLGRSLGNAFAARPQITGPSTRLS